MKRFAIITLHTINALIILSAFTFTVYSIMTHNTMTIFSKQFPAYFMGFIVIYLGLISIVRINRLSKEIKSRKFSFDNFKSNKKK